MKAVSSVHASNSPLLVSTLEIAMNRVTHAFMKLLEKHDSIVDGGAHIHIDVAIYDRFHDSLLQTVHRDHILRPQSSFHQIHRMLTLTLNQSELLLVETPINDAHGEVSHIFPLDDGTQHDFLSAATPQNPLHVSQRDRPHVAGHAHLLEPVLEKRPVLQRADFARVQNQGNFPVFLGALHWLGVSRGFRRLGLGVDELAETLVGRRGR